MTGQFGSTTQRDETDMDSRHWLTLLITNIKKLNIKAQLRRKQQQAAPEVDCLDKLQQIPEDWQNTLVKNYPSLRRSNSSSSSFTSSRSSSSAYSVNDFLRDLSAGEDLESLVVQNRKSKTSTPVTCHILPLNRLGCHSPHSQPASLLHDLSGLKIYDDQMEENENPVKPLRIQQTFHHVPQNDLYENQAFHQRLDEECRRMNQEDEEDGYEIIVIKNTESKRSNCRTLKHRLKN